MYYVRHRRSHQHNLTQQAEARKTLILATHQQHYIAQTSVSDTIDE